MSEIYEITTRARTLYVEAETGTKAVAYARRGLTARKLSGSEARALPADTVILDSEFDLGEEHPDREEP